jgi:hypothetical protein
MTTAEIPRRSYITTAAFHQDIFAYTTSYNPATFTTTGTLTSLSTAGTGTAANCPANRVLRENGKKLFPPGLLVSNNTTYAAPNPGVTTYMVGVYDPITFLSGFIDPNSKLFAIYNTDKPDYVPRGINPNGNTEVDEGAPVYTLGSVKAGTTVSAGTGIVTTSGQIRAATITALTSITTNGAQTAQTLDTTLGSIFTITTSAPSGAASITLNVSAAAALIPGSRIELLITATTVQNTTFTFGTNIVSNSTYVVTAAAGPVTSYYAISFVCDGTQFFEISRTATQA